MDDATLENLNDALNIIDVGVEQCMYPGCNDWIVVHYQIINGIRCDKCKGYFCRNHGTRTEKRTYPIQLEQVCVNCT